MIFKMARDRTEDVMDRYGREGRFAMASEQCEFDS